MRFLLFSVALLAGTLVSCAVPTYQPAGKRCDDAHPCPNGLSCVVGFCGPACDGPPPACSGTARPCVTSLAGTDGPGFVDGPPHQARFRRPTRLLALPEGALVVADTGNHALRKIPLDGGAVTTIAGNGTCDDADSKSLCEPYGLAQGADGVLYVTNLLSDTVSRVDEADVQRIVGTGLPADLVRPTGVAFAGGRLAVTRTNYCELEFLETDGRRARNDAGTPVSLGGCAMLDGLTVGYLAFVAPSVDEKTLYFGDGVALWSVPLTNGLPSGPAKLLAGGNPGFRDGPPSVAQFDDARELVATGDALYVADSRNHRVRKLTLGGTASTLLGTGVPGSTDGPATGPEPALVTEPSGLAVVGDAVYFTSTVDHRIRKFENGQVTTIAGPDPAPLVDGCAESIPLAAPAGVDVDPHDGTLYFTDALHHAVRALGTNGTVVTLLGGTPGEREGDFTQARVNTPGALRVLPDGGVVVADTGNGLVVQLDVKARTMKTIVGSVHPIDFARAGCQPQVDRQPLAAQLCVVRGLAVSSTGDVFLTDCAEPGFGVVWRLSADHSRLDELVRDWFFPRGLTVAPNGELIVADVDQNVVLRFDPQGRALGSVVGNDACENGSHWERECVPTDVAYVNGQLHVLFEGTSTISRVPPTGRPVTVLGQPFATGLVDGPVGTLMDSPAAFAVTPDGGVVVADQANQRLRLLWP